MSRGVIYVATGTRYIEEACRSAASLKQLHPDWSITLFGDRQPPNGLFDNVIPVQAGRGFATRLSCLAATPYDETLALDTDTWIASDISDLFALLKRYELGAALAPIRQREPDIRVLGDAYLGIPTACTQLNPGVMVYAKTDAVIQLWSEWLRLYLAHEELAAQANYHHPAYGGVSDQASLRQALFESKVRWCVLPSEYNCVFGLPGYLDLPVRIAHGRHPDLSGLVACLNSMTGPRTHNMVRYKLTLISSAGEQRTFQTASPAAQVREDVKVLRDSMERRGIGGTLRFVRSRIAYWRRRTAPDAGNRK